MIEKHVYVMYSIEFGLTEYVTQIGKMWIDREPM